MPHPQPPAEQPGEGPVTYLLRVKTAESAEKLMNTIKENMKVNFFLVKKHYGFKKLKKNAHTHTVSFNDVRLKWTETAENVIMCIFSPRTKDI